MPRTSRPVEFEIMKRETQRGPRFYYHIEGGNHEITNPSEAYPSYSHARSACEGVWFAFARAIIGNIMLSQRKAFILSTPVPYTANSYKPSRGPKPK